MTHVVGGARVQLAARGSVVQAHIGAVLERLVSPSQLARLIRAADLSRAELARRSDCSRQRVDYLVHGEKPTVSDELADRIRAAIRARLMDLVAQVDGLFVAPEAAHMVSGNHPRRGSGNSAL